MANSLTSSHATAIIHILDTARVTGQAIVDPARSAPKDKVNIIFLYPSPHTPCQRRLHPEANIMSPVCTFVQIRITHDQQLEPTKRKDLSSRKPFDEILNADSPRTRDLLPTSSSLF